MIDQRTNTKKAFRNDFSSMKMALNVEVLYTMDKKNERGIVQFIAYLHASNTMGIKWCSCWLKITAKEIKRYVSSSLVFHDRPAQKEVTTEIRRNNAMSWENSRKKDPKCGLSWNIRNMRELGLIRLAAFPRVMLGKSRSQNNGLFLFDTEGKTKAMFYVDKENSA